jgi:hypothetical protein
MIVDGLLEEVLEVAAALEVGTPEPIDGPAPLSMTPTAITGAPAGAVDVGGGAVSLAPLD